MSPTSATVLRLALPKGRMFDGVLRLLQDAGIEVDPGGQRGYRPRLSLPGTEAKLLKPQSIVEMLHAGTRDVGFTGADWVAERGADLVELLDTGLDPVRLVAAAPETLLGADRQLPAGRRLRVASEMTALTRAWVERRGFDAEVVRSHGATEVLPPEDADLIVDLCASGATLRANHLVEVDVLMASSTRLWAHPSALRDAAKRDTIDALVLLLRSVLDARARVMLELNVPEEQLEAVIQRLPCMREPTVSALAHGAGYAVRAAVPRAQLARLIPELKGCGGTDLVVTNLAQIVP